ncbi:MAG: hypothetical protein ACTJLL_00915 [Anaplasma sp.]
MKKETKKPKSKISGDKTPLLSEDLSYMENESNFFPDTSTASKKDGLVSKIRKKLTKSPSVASSDSSRQNKGESRDAGSQGTMAGLRRAAKLLRARASAGKIAPHIPKIRPDAGLKYGSSDISYVRFESPDSDLQTDDLRMGASSMESFAPLVEDSDPKSVFGAPSDPNEVWTASFDDTGTTSRNPGDAAQESTSSIKAPASEPIYAVPNKVRTGRASARQDTPASTSPLPPQTPTMAAAARSSSPPPVPPRTSTTGRPSSPPPVPPQPSTTARPSAPPPPPPLPPQTASAAKSAIRSKTAATGQGPNNPDLMSELSARLAQRNAERGVTVETATEAPKAASMSQDSAKAGTAARSSSPPPVPPRAATTTRSSAPPSPPPLPPQTSAAAKPAMRPKTAATGQGLNNPDLISELSAKLAQRNAERGATAEAAPGTSKASTMSQESARAGTAARPSSPPPVPPRAATTTLSANAQARRTVSFSKQVLVSTFDDGPGPGTLKTEPLRGDHGAVEKERASPSSTQADNARSGSNTAEERAAAAQGKHVSSLMREAGNNAPAKGVGR